MIRSVASAVLSLAIAAPATAGTFVQAELQPADLTQGSLFGRSVAAGGQILVAGAFTQTAPGAAYVYQRSGDTWTLVAELHAPQPAVRDEFGLSVATDGTTIVVGAVGETYVFVNNSGVWTAQAQFAITGFSVAVRQDTMAVTGGGQVDVFRRSNSGAWNAEASWAIPPATAVSLDANTLVVGAAAANTPAGIEAGAAFVFVRDNNTWTQQASLSANDAGPLALYGAAVSISGDTAVIGAPGEGPDRLNPRTGSAYVYVRNNGNWTLQNGVVRVGRERGLRFRNGAGADREHSCGGSL